jgi:xanthine/uracil permease
LSEGGLVFMRRPKVSDTFGAIVVGAVIRAFALQLLAKVLHGEAGGTYRTHYNQPMTYGGALALLAIMALLVIAIAFRFWRDARSKPDAPRTEHSTEKRR